MHPQVMPSKETGTPDNSGCTNDLSSGKKRMVADGDNPDSRRGAVLLRIDPEKEAGKLICQVGTGEAGLAVKAVERVVGDVTGIDVNMGCPKKISVGGGMGRLVSRDCADEVRFICQMYTSFSNHQCFVSFIQT